MFSLHVDTAKTWRGGQNQVMLTVLGLRARGHRTAVIAHPEGELRQRLPEGPDFFPIVPRTEIDLRAAWQVSQVLRQLEPSVVHAHDAHAVAVSALGISIAGSALRTKLIASRRVDFHIGANIFSRWKYRQVDRFICVSSCIRSMLIGDGIPANKTTVVYEGIDLEKVNVTPPIDIRKEFSLPHDALIVGNVAALVPHKGQCYLVDAAARVVRTIPEARFLVIGDGELAETLQQQIEKLNLQRHVLLTGFRSDVLSLHKEFDLFVMSSLTEGLGTSVLDAMARERAVIATRTGGLSEVVINGETGTLVPTGNPDALANAIIHLLKDSARRAQYGRSGLGRVHHIFNAERMVAETLEVYERLVDTHPARDNAYQAVVD